MGRKARKMSSTGIYHVMLRGNNREQVFFTNRDENVFLAILEQQKVKHNMKMYSYCLMPNHVHLAVKEPEEGLISKFMYGLETAFTKWYNTDHEKSGHVFQGRFKSEPVETNEYLANLIRYIHNNPVKAHICSHPGHFRASSYILYFTDDPGIIDRDDVFEIITKEEFAAFHNKELDTDQLEFMEMEENLQPRVVNDKALEIIKTLSGCENGMRLLGLGMDKIREVFCACRKRGLSYRQIGDFVKKGRSTVLRIVNGTTKSVQFSSESSDLSSTPVSKSPPL